MDMIGADIKMVLTKNGFTSIAIKNIITPAWTTEWMSKEGKEKLTTYGIAPPDKRFTIPTDGVTCPRCSSQNTKLLSEFGSTACKALYQCNDCKEPFDYFKCH
jgi:ring-1,2-phenylacetyl-CoA epoxidase subunit PaaD